MSSLLVQCSLQVQRTSTIVYKQYSTVQYSTVQYSTVDTLCQASVVQLQIGS